MSHPLILRVLSICGDQEPRKEQTTTFAFQEAGRASLAGACLLDAAWRSVPRLRRKCAESGVHEAGLTRGRRAQPRPFPEGTGRCQWTPQLASDFAAAISF